LDIECDSKIKTHRKNYDEMHDRNNYERLMYYIGLPEEKNDRDDVQIQDG